MIHPFLHAMHPKSASGASGEGFAAGALTALLALGFGSFMVASAFTSLGVILPRIEGQFDAGISTVQWVINAYALVCGVLLIGGGRLADQLGRQRILFIGIAIFGGASILAGAAPGVIWLILARALMGVGGALMWPPMLSIAYSILPKSRAALAGGIIIGAMGLGAASGPLIGGAVAELASWRWVLFINAPVAAFVFVIVRIKLRIPPQPRHRERIDFAGMAALAVSLFALLLALDQASDWGFGDWRIIALFAFAALLLASFVAIERHAGEGALVPGRLLRQRTLSSALGARILIAGTWFVSLVYLPGFMEKVYGYSPFEAGLGMLPMMFTFALVSFAAGPLYMRTGAKLMGVGGIAFLFIGSVLLVPITPHSGYVTLLPGLLLMGVGYGFCATALNTAGVMAVPAEHTSLAGAMLLMSQWVGGSVGLGAATTILSTTVAAHVRASALASGLNASQLRAVGHILAGGQSGRTLLERFPHSAATLENLAREAFALGLRHAFMFVSTLGIISVLVAVLFFGSWRSGGTKKGKAGNDVRVGAKKPISSE